MDGSNAITCDVCASKQDHWLGTRLNDLPLTLVLTFNRFDFDFEKMDRVKLNSLFQFQLELDLAPHLPHQPGIDFGYELYGVIIHRGSAHGGHYYCFARDLMRESDWSGAQAKEKQRK
jgi:ubiquitin carboxyl-terminal hydrolase 40